MELAQWESRARFSMVLWSACPAVTKYHTWYGFNKNKRTFLLLWNLQVLNQSIGRFRFRHISLLCRTPGSLFLITSSCVPVASVPPEALPCCENPRDTELELTLAHVTLIPPGKALSPFTHSHVLRLGLQLEFQRVGEHNPEVNSCRASYYSDRIHRK